MAQAEHIVEECVIPNVVAWSTHESGSHVVRASLKHGTRANAAKAARIVEEIVPHVAEWGCHKISSHIIVAALRRGTPTMAARIVEEIIPRVVEWSCHENGPS